MTPEEKLKIFREKISNATIFDNSFRQLLGIELFDFIHANNILKNEFNRRLNYLKNLADNKDFKLLQDNLFEIIQKILKLTSLKEVKERQKEWNNALINKLKTRCRIGRKKKDFLTLPELYLELQNKDAYYRLGDSSYFSPMDGEISISTHIVPVKKQYEVNVEGLFKHIFSNKFINDKKEHLRLDKLIKEYNEYWYKLDELIYRIPIQLHLRNFERFFFDCTKFYQRQGYEFHYNFLSNSANRKTETQFRETKENALMVIDDLVVTLKEKNEISQDKKSLKSIHLITNSLEPSSVIFLVLDERFEMPIRCKVKNPRGEPAYIKKLYNIAYDWDVPNKKVNYDRNVADSINNGLFKKRAVAKYMKTNKFKKPTLVQKSENGTLVLKNDIQVKRGLVKNDVPMQYQSLYIDKTK